MPDNDTQKAVEKSLKRISNQTPNDIRERLNQSLIGFQQRTDIIRATAEQQNPATGVVTRGTPPASVTVVETVIPVTSIALNKKDTSDPFTPPSTPGGTALPDGSAGDMLYHDGTDWVLLAAPSAPADPKDNPVLRHTGTAPYWDTPEAC